MAVVSMKQLLEAGVHFGHQTRRWNPKMAKYIFTERNGIYIIDLQKTVKKLDEAYNYVKEVAAGYECGISIVDYRDFREGDIIEAYTMEEVETSITDVNKAAKAARAAKKAAEAEAAAAVDSEEK